LTVAYKTLSFHLKSESPLLMHRGGLADPMDPFAQQMKRISGKRDKTEADFMEMARIEWYGGLYADENQHPCLPGEVVEATLINAAKKIKRGKQAQAGIICPGNFPLVYDGPDNLDELWEDARFRFTTGVRVQRNRVMRTRPRFNEWQVKIDVQYDPQLLNPSEVTAIVKRSGEEIGFGDWRPKFGRFIVVDD
jgi:hypothetical protein